MRKIAQAPQGMPMRPARFVAHEGLAAARLQDFQRGVLHFRVESDGPANKSGLLPSALLLAVALLRGHFAERFAVLLAE